MKKDVERWYSGRLETDTQLVRWGDFGTPVLLFPTAGGDAEEVERFHLVGVLGDLTVTFDDQGRVTACEGRAYLPIADSFKRRGADRKRVELEGADREAVLADVEANPAILVVTQTVSLYILGSFEALDNAEDQTSKTTGLVLRALPFMLGYFAMNAPAGLGLYWIFNNLLTTASTFTV